MEAALGERWTLKVAEEMRVGDDVSQLYEEFIDAGLSRKITGWLGIGVNYRHIYKRNGVLWKMENRPHVNLTLAWKIWGLSFKDRQRLEFRSYEAGDDSRRYRNKLTLTLPASLAGSLARPYVAGEAFVDLEENDFNRYRLYVGLKRRVVWRLSLDLSYMRQSSETGDDWNNLNIAIAALKLGF